MTITPANVSKLLSVTTACFWIVVGLVYWHDVRSGNLMQKDGLSIVVIYFTGTCGPVFWAMIAPSTLSAFRNHAKPIGAGAWAKAFWCFSSAPVVFLCFGLYCLMVYTRITD